jgi:TolA-binding protein
VIWVAVGAATFVILVALVIGLIRQMKRVAGAVARLNREVQPLLLQMREETERIQERSLELESKRQAMADEGAEARRRARRRVRR